MKILVFGAGTIGSIYASRLYESNENVTLLARGKNYDDLNRNGISLRNDKTGKLSNHKIRVANELISSADHDLIIVTVRMDQVQSAIDCLKTINKSTLVLFMMNNSENLEEIQSQLPGMQVLFGFPGVGGFKNGNTIEYISIKQQKTTFGEVGNQKSVPALRKLQTLFESAGFKTAISSHMQNWLITHAIFISCISAAILNFDGDSFKLSEDKNKMKEMIQSIREGFEALESLNISIEPKNLKLIFMKMPLWFSVLYWQKALRSKLGSVAIAPHAVNALPEIQLVARKALEIANTSKIPIPKLNDLLSTLINRKPTLP